MEAYKETNNVRITLSQDEAIVLFEWLIKFNERENLEFEDQSEERILWDLESVLEKISLIALDSDYKILLSQARERIRDKEENV